MKMLNVNSGFISLFFLLIISVILTSCEHKIMDEIPVHEEVAIADNTIPKGRLTKRLVLSDKNDATKRAVIMVSTNTSEILHQLTNANIEAKMLTSSDLEQLNNDQVPEDVDAASEDQDPSLINSEIHFFSLTILEENIADVESIQYTFSNELLAVLKKYKASTHIQFPTEYSNTQDSREQVWKNGFWAYGDGGSIRTKLHVRYDYNCQAYFYGRDTQTGFFNSYKFRSCRWPWTSSSRKRYSGFWVIQDVLRNFTTFNTSECQRC